MARRPFVLLLSLLTALAPIATSAFAGTDLHCHEQASVSHRVDVAGAGIAVDAPHASHGPTVAGDPFGVQHDGHAMGGTASSCGCDCSCATGSGCTILACVPIASLLIEQFSGDRPDSLADANHARGRGPPPSPPPIESWLQR